jgi:hypothetical protein
MKKFFAKGLSGRKVELDEVIEPEQDDQSSATPEMFWKRQLHSWLTRLQSVVVTTSKFLFNQVDRNQIARFEDEILLDNSNQQYTKKR